MRCRWGVTKEETLQRAAGWKPGEEVVVAGLRSELPAGLECVPHSHAPPVGHWVGCSKQQLGDTKACDSVWLEVPGEVASVSPGEGVGFWV